MHADAWGALGGEPLLSPDLQDVLKIARASGIADKIQLYTNGLLLPKQPDSLWGLVDFIRLAVYEGKHTPESIDWIVRKCADHGVDLEMAEAGPNFRPCFEPVVPPPDEIVEKFNTCFMRWNCRAVNDGYFFTCSVVQSISRLVQKIPYKVDGILIETTNEAELQTYLERTTPIEACKDCAGWDRAPNIKWSEERDPEAWSRKSGRAL
jgi:hypothetical protein